MLWMGIAAAVVFALVWLFDGMSLLLQVVLFVVLSFVSIQVYRTWFRKAARQSDQPLLNRRAEQLVGRVVVLEQAIVDGSGRAKVDDALWVVAGPDLPVDSRVRVVAVDGMTLKVQPA
jgi:membrane protein implicated in regulation of membrane protease activity